MDKIPILLYHDFCSETDKSKNNFAVTWDNFKKQMDYLHHNGYVAVSLEKMRAEAEYWKGEEGVEKRQEGRGAREASETRKKVVLTFDDGDLSNYHFVLPILKEKGFNATFFVTVNEIGKPGRMDWSMVYDLSRNGMGVGSHGLSHSFLTGRNNYKLLNELLMSKQVLEKYIRKRVDFVSIPHGFYNKRVLAIARDVGFKAACVSDAGFSDLSDGSLFMLKRFTMRKNYGLDAFKSVVCGRPSASVNVGENIRAVLRRALGYQVYDRLRRIRHKGKKEVEI